MNNSNFEILHFPYTRGKRMPDKGYSITITNQREGVQNKTNRIILSSEASREVLNRDLTHVQLHVERYTSSVFLVFFQGDDRTDARISKEKSSARYRVRVNNRGLVDYLAKKVKKTGNFKVKLELSPNLSNDDNFATFRINFNKEL